MKRKQRDYSSGPWNRRIWHLAGTLGVTIPELGFRLGLKDKRGHSMYRILHGGRPKVGFLLKLEKMEAAYAREIARFVKDHCNYEKRRSRKERGTLEIATQRSEDIKEMGDVAALGKAKPKKVLIQRFRLLDPHPTARRRLLPKVAKFVPRRPEAESGEQEEHAQ